MLMSKTLSELVGADEPLFSVGIEQLERASGNLSVDVRLTAEIIGKAHQKTRELGLDPADTTGKELYQALKELIKKHDGFIAKRLGVKDTEDVADVLPRVKAFLEQIDIPKSAWVMKCSVAKRLLKSMPPKKVMKQLNYRSIDSLLKRESVGEIFSALRFVESPEWLESFLAKYKRLTPQDFEVRDIEFLLIDPKKWGDSADRFVREKRHNVTCLKELGVIMLLPMPLQRMRGLSITALPLLLHYVNEIRLYSAYFKLRQMSPRFGSLLAEILHEDPHNHAVMAGQPVHWRTVHRHFGKRGSVAHPEIFEPHLQPEDLMWHKAEEILYRVEPALHFWHDMDYVGSFHGDQMVSFNLMDMAVSYVNDLPFERHSTHHMRDSLWNEIYSRYMGHQALESQVLRQFGGEVSGSEVEIFDLEGIF